MNRERVAGVREIVQQPANVHSSRDIYFFRARLIEGPGASLAQKFKTARIKFALVQRTFLGRNKQRAPPRLARIQITRNFSLSLDPW